MGCKQLAGPGRAKLAISSPPDAKSEEDKMVSGKMVSVQFSGPVRADPGVS
jgi:hypothetical protein